MSQFVFQTTKRIVAELGSSRTALPNLVSGQGKRTLLVTDKGLMKLGLVDEALKALKAKSVDVQIYDDVCEDPSEQVVLNATRIAKDMGAQSIIGFGGGSSMDVAKLVAVLASDSSSQDLSEMYGVGMIESNAPQTQRLPLFQVPTTAGTGSEVTPISILTTGASEKKGVVDPILLPDVALLDGNLTVTVPQHVTAATGIDAMVHAIEAYTSKIKKNPLSDSLAESALKLLGRNIRRVVLDDPSDMQARSDMLLGSCFAGMAFANSPVAAVHALAYPIGSHFHVPHGLSNALMLPHVMRANMDVDLCAQQYSEIASLCLPGATFSSDPREAAAQLADGLASLSVDLKMKTQLREVGIKESDVALLASESMKQTRLLQNNPREVTLDLATDLYSKAW